MREEQEEQIKVYPITNLKPKDWNGYIQYRPHDGVVMIGRTGDSDWVELSPYVAGMFEWDLVEGVNQND